MLSKENARTAIGVIGNIISLVLFLSPAQTFYRIWKKKSVEEYSAVPYLATFANCFLWGLYGLPIVHPHSILVVTINGAGFLIEIVFLSMFLVFSGPTKRTRVLLVLGVECVCLAAMAFLVLTMAHTIKLRSAVVGSIAMAANILMYAAPLSVMKLVITTRSVEYMPFSLSLFSFLNAVCWTTYAFMPLDPFLLAPNVTGAVLGLAQLILYGAFYKSTKNVMTSKQAQLEMGLPESKRQNRPPKSELTSQAQQSY